MDEGWAHLIYVKGARGTTYQARWVDATGRIRTKNFKSEEQARALVDLYTAIKNARKYAAIWGSIIGLMGLTDQRADHANTTERINKHARNGTTEPLTGAPHDT